VNAEKETKMDELGKVMNYVDGAWRLSKSAEALSVVNPATTRTMAHVPLSTKEETVEAIEAASKALTGWRQIPATERIQYLFKLKVLLRRT
jgi:malonate-semialdehyde dehydrogenase (acetylating)/methylmalonate-semialdehyde dehydrogenase